MKQENIALAKAFGATDEDIRKMKKFSEMTFDEQEAELEWITEALGEGYTKKQLAKQYGCSVPTLNKFLRGGGN